MVRLLKRLFLRLFPYHSETRVEDVFGSSQRKRGK